MTDAVVVGGLGIIGAATRKLFKIKDYYDLKGVSDIFENLAKRKYVFLCLPTLPDRGGYDLDVIEEMIMRFEEYHLPDRVYILRSTVLPGTADSLMERFGIKIVSNPEFLTMRTIDEDTFNPDIVVCGSKIEGLAIDLANLYREHVKNNPKFYITYNKEAEMIKLAINVFYTTKIVFANHIYDICEKEEISYDVVREAMYHRKWIGKNHLQTIHDGKRGAGGKCLRKDLSAFNLKYELPFFEMVERINDRLLGIEL